MYISFVNDSPSSVVEDVIESVCNESKLIENIALLLKYQVSIYDHSIIQFAQEYKIKVDECKTQMQDTDYNSASTNQK